MMMGSDKGNERGPQYFALLMIKTRHQDHKKLNNNDDDDDEFDDGVDNAVDHRL